MRFISFFLAAFLVAGWTLAGDMKIATVDLQKLFKDYPGTQTAESKLKDIEKKKIKELTPMEDELKDLQNELQNNSSVLSKKEKQEKKELFGMKMDEYTKAKSQMQLDLQTKESDMTQTVLVEIKGIIAGVAKDKGYDLVLDSEKTAYVKGGSDLTDDVEKSSQFKAFADSSSSK
jgi:outer membrane protein